jgi:hypothetical protein
LLLFVSFMKRGISTIVATVLIVLVTVASVTILWAGVYPLLEGMMFVEPVNVKVAVEKGSYTLYDETNDLLKVRVTRGADEANIIAIKFLLEQDGNTHSHTSYEVLAPNTAKVYSFRVPDAVNSKTVQIAVVPIYEVQGSEVESERESMFVSPIVSDLTDDGGFEDFVGGETGECSPECSLDTPFCNDGVCVECVGDIDCGLNAPYCVSGFCEVCEEGDLNCISVDSCRNLDGEGLTYRLERDISISGNCFMITADNVILDFNGFSIFGDGTGNGVNVEGINNFEVYGGTIDNFASGFFCTLSNSGELRDLIIESNNIGLNLFSNCNSNSLQNIDCLFNSQYGIQIYSSNNNHFDMVNSSFNGRGLFLTSSASSNTITNGFFCSNTPDIWCSSSGNTIFSVYTTQGFCPGGNTITSLGSC